MAAETKSTSIETQDPSTSLQDLEGQILVEHERSTKAYLIQMLEKENATRADRATVLQMLHDIQKINAPSFFMCVNGREQIDINTVLNTYTPKRKRLDPAEKRSLITFTEQRNEVQKKDASGVVKQALVHLNTVYGHASFVDKHRSAEGGKLLPYLDRMNTQRATVKDKVTPPQSTAFFMLLMADTDYDGKIESLSQRDTTRKGNRRRLEKTQKLEGRGVLSEQGFVEMIDKVCANIETNKKPSEKSPAEDILAKNLAGYFAKMDRYVHLQSTLNTVNTMKGFVDLLLAEPSLLSALRIQAHSTPTDLMKIMEWGTGEGFTDLINTRDASEKQSKEDQKKIEEYLKSNAAKPEIEKQQSVLKEKLDEHRTSIEEKIIKLNSLTPAEIDAKGGVEEVRKEISGLVELIQQLKTVPDADLRRMCIDLMSVGGVVSLIPNTTGVGAGASFSFYEGKATDLINSAGFQIAGFQQIGGSKATAFGLSLVVGGTLANSKKNTLFYSLQAGGGVQLVQKMLGHGFAFGAMIGDEMRVNEKKMKSLRPSQKLIVGALAGAGYALGVPDPRSVSAGIYLRRDRLGALAEQEGEIYLLVQDIMSKATSTDRASLRGLIETYCKDQKIKKQRPEDIDRIAEVLHRAFLPYKDNLTAFQASKQEGDLAPERMGAVAAQIALDRFNRKTDEVNKVAITGVGVGASANFLGIYPSAGIQISGRHSSVYLPDEQSVQRHEHLLTTSEYDQKLEGSFADQLVRLNKLIPTESNIPATTVYRQVDGLGNYPFVILPDHLLDNPQVDILIAPALQNKETSGVHFKRNEANGNKEAPVGWEIPATVPVKFVETIDGNVKKVTLIIGGHNATNAIPLTKELTPAKDDAWIINEQQTKNSLPANQGKVEKQYRETMHTFLKGKETQATNKRNLPFDLSSTDNIKTTRDLTTGRITDYLLPLKNASQIASLGENPTYKTKTESGTTYLVVPVGQSVQIYHSSAVNDNKQPRRIEMKPSTDLHARNTFSYTEYPQGFADKVTAQVGIDLLTKVDPDLKAFLGSTAGTEMLMKRRYDNVDKKDAYYAAIQNDLKDPKQNYADSFKIAKGYIDRATTNPKLNALFNTKTSNKDFRANLYAIYGALSRVRMTEYKHLTDPVEKTVLLEKLLVEPTIANKNLSTGDQELLRNALASGTIIDENEIINVLKKLDSRFDGWKDGNYYMYHENRQDPVYRLIFLFAPIAKIFETRTTATKKILNGEFGQDKTSANALNTAYTTMQKKLNMTGTKEQLFLQKQQMNNAVGLVFGYGADAGGTKQVDEKFVIYPEAIGPQIDISATSLENTKIKEYFLNNYVEKNPHDVQEEAKSLYLNLLNAFEVDNVNLNETQKEQYLTSFGNKLFTNFNDINSDKTGVIPQVNFTAYKELMLTGTMSGLDARWKQSATRKPVRKTAVFGDCVNFMITKDFPEITLNLPKTLPVPANDEVVPVVPPVAPGEVVTAQDQIHNQANRRETTVSLGVVAKAPTKQEQAVSTTTPIELTSEQEALINIEGEQSSVMVPLGDGGTQVQVDAFAGSFDGKPGVYYIDNATGNRQFREGTVQNPPLGGPGVFTPAGSGGPLTDLSFLYNPRNYEMINQALQRQIVSAERQGTDGRKYVKQLKALERQHRKYLRKQTKQQLKEVKAADQERKKQAKEANKKTTQEKEKK